MSSRHFYQKANDSKSLWNYTLSPGWSCEAGEALRKAIMRYGCGNWQKIQRHFPDKTNGQLNLQTQRLFGQQSLAAWNKVHVDPLIIKRINDKKKDAFRKNGCIVNTGDNMTQEQKIKLKKFNEKNYGLNENVYKRIKVPIIMEQRIDLTMNDKINKLAQLYKVHNMIYNHRDNVRSGKNANTNANANANANANTNVNKSTNTNENKNENFQKTRIKRNKSSTKKKNSKTRLSNKKKQNRKRKTFDEDYNPSNKPPSNKKQRIMNKSNNKDNKENNDNDVAITSKTD